MGKIIKIILGVTALIGIGCIVYSVIKDVINIRNMKMGDLFDDDEFAFES